MTPAAKSAGNTRPMAASIFTSRERARSSDSTTVRTPVSGRAQHLHRPRSLPVSSQTTMMPKTMEWLMASVSMALPRSTRKEPSSAPEAADQDAGQHNHRRDRVEEGAIIAGLPRGLCGLPDSARPRRGRASVSSQCGWFRAGG
jgi:hypothetical protein